MPGAENSFAAIARIAARSGACESPNEVFFGWTSGERMTTLVTTVPTDLLHDRGQGRQLVDRHVRADRVADGVEQVGQLEQQAAATRRLVAQGEQDLLLACLPGEVALADRLPRPGIGQGVGAVEMMRAGGDGVARALEPEPVVGRVGEALGHVDVDPADRVDHLDEAVEVKAGVVVDRDAEERADRILERAQAALRVVLRVAVREMHQRVELGPEHVAIAERRADQVARDRHDGHRVADRVERCDHHRVGQVRRPLAPLVRAHDEHVHPLAVARDRAGVGAADRGRAEDLAGEDAIERVAQDRP